MTARPWPSAAIAAVALLASALALPAVAPAQPRAGAAATDDNFAIEHQIGQRFRVDPDNLPPLTGKSASNGPRVVPYAGQVPAVPPGFAATLFATGIANPRRLLVLPNGDILVAQQGIGRVLRLRDDGAGHAVSIDHVAGFQGPYGLAARGDEVLVADQNGIWRVPASSRRPEPITRSGVFGATQGHSNRPIAIDPKTGKLFVGVGSMGNIAVEPEPKATIQRFDADGSNQENFAAGTRNPTTLAVQPDTGELWAGVQERDGLGDDLPSDYLIRVQRDGFYGWPYAYLGPHPQPGYARLAPRKVVTTIVPDLLLQAHSSLLDLVFYDADQFPPTYRRGAFVALKGSWNRSMPTGYKVAWVPFKDNRPAGYYENFAVGFWESGLDRAQVWGRPAALAVDINGSLLVADDTGGTIWRISYTGTP